MHHHMIMKMLKSEDRHPHIMNVRNEGSLVNLDILYTQGHHACPFCGQHTSKVHDYRVETIKHGDIQGYHVIPHCCRSHYVCKRAI